MSPLFDGELLSIGFVLDNLDRRRGLSKLSLTESPEIFEEPEEMIQSESEPVSVKGDQYAEIRDL